MGQARDVGEFEEIKKNLTRVGVNFKHGASDVQRAVESLEVPNLHEPEAPAAGASPFKLKKWEANYDDYWNNKKAWEDAKPRLYQLILPHCHPDMEQKVRHLRGLKGSIKIKTPLPCCN